MPDVNRKLSPKAKQVLCAFAELKEDAQQAFNGALNEYLLASPSKRRQLIKHWQESVEEASRRDVDDPAAQAGPMT